jgi:hypothetical protein
MVNSLRLPLGVKYLWLLPTRAVTADITILAAKMRTRVRIDILLNI